MSSSAAAVRVDLGQQLVAQPGDRVEQRLEHRAHADAVDLEGHYVGLLERLDEHDAGLRPASSATIAAYGSSSARRPARRGW